MTSTRRETRDVHVLSLNIGVPRENPWKGSAATGHDVTVALTLRAFTTEPHLLPRLAVASALPDEAEALVRNRTR